MGRRLCLRRLASATSTAAATRSVGWVLFGRREFDEEAGVELDIDEEVAAGRALRIVPSGFESYFTIAFAALGDLDDDGIDDFALGLANELALGAGHLVLLPGRREWPGEFDPLDPTTSLADVSGSFGFASAIVRLGDVNGDGVEDLHVSLGAIEASPVSYVLFLGDDLAGSIDLESLIAVGGGIRLERAERGGSFPPFPHIAASGDVNCDGYDDILLSDEFAGDTNRGLTFVVPGGPDLAPTIRITDVEGEPDGILRVAGSTQRVQSGRGLGPAGDYNADGCRDFLVGEQNGLDPFAPGTMYVVFGGPEPPARIELRRPGRHAYALAGTHRITRLEVSATTTGDLNGDGREDFAFSEWATADFPTDGDGGPSPGAVWVVYGLPESVPFKRGDANFDGEINVSDAVFILAHLFLGGPTPSCEDAADVQDDGVIDVSDAVRVLGSLFLGLPDPPPPFAEPGVDLTDDALGCRGY